MEEKSDNNILKLRVEDEDDLSVIASLLQDALVTVEDMALLPASSANLNQQFVLITSRFCWEKSCQDTAQPSPTPARIHTALIIDHVKSVQYKGIDRSDKNLILSLLTVTKDPENCVSIYFAGDGILRIEIDRLSCILHDMAEPWPTKFVPHHKIG